MSERALKHHDLPHHSGYRIDQDINGRLARVLHCADEHVTRGD
jgi:hypothetical protein